MFGAGVGGGWALQWITTAEGLRDMDWLESVQLVFDYFCERTPRSFVQAGSRK